VSEASVSETTEQGPLAGIRVLEVAMYGFVPSAGAVLADWGADVIKVEHAVTGDPQRGLVQVGSYRIDSGPNPNIEHANRGKRSIGLHMGTPEGSEHTALALIQLSRALSADEQAELSRLPPIEHALCLSLDPA